MKWVHSLIGGRFFFQPVFHPVGHSSSICTNLVLLIPYNSRYRHQWKHDKQCSFLVGLCNWSHAILVSKAGSVIDGKSPSPVFKRSCKLCDIAFIIECDSSSILNAILPSLSVNYGSVYLPLSCGSRRIIQVDVTYTGGGSGGTPPPTWL